MSPFDCSICHNEYPTLEEAEQCASQGVKGNELHLGDRICLPFNGGVIYEVIELLTAAYITHVPGVRLKLVEGDISALYIGEPEEEAMFDEETAKKYLIR